MTKASAIAANHPMGELLLSALGMLRNTPDGDGRLCGIGRHPGGDPVFPALDLAASLLAGALGGPLAEGLADRVAAPVGACAGSLRLAR